MYLHRSFHTLHPGVSGNRKHAFLLSLCFSFRGKGNVVGKWTCFFHFIKLVGWEISLIVYCVLNKLPWWHSFWYSTNFVTPFVSFPFCLFVSIPVIFFLFILTFIKVIYNHSQIQGLLQKKLQHSPTLFLQIEPLSNLQITILYYISYLSTSYYGR